MGLITVFYGSTAWGPQFYDKRGDVDIAVLHQDHIYGTDPENAEAAGSYLSRSMEFGKRCFLHSQESGVDIDSVPVGNRGEKGTNIDAYTGESIDVWHMPAPLVDQMKILDRKIGGYGEFVRALTKKRLDRLGDFTSYLSYMTIIGFDPLQPTRYELGKDDDSDMLEVMGKLENFPYHTIRRALGREHRLPTPDSRENLRDRFFGVPYKWEIRDKWGTHFRRLFAVSNKYQALMQDVQNGISRDEYYERLNSLREGMRWPWLNIINDFSNLCNREIGILQDGLQRFLEIQR